MLIKMKQIFLLVTIISFCKPSSQEKGLEYLKVVVPTYNLKQDCKEIHLIPTNNFCSIVYRLYSPANRNSPCYFEPENEQFNNCEFDSNRETKILIHGFMVKLKPGNQFELIKDAYLSRGDYNVIIVDWTRYNQASYEQAYYNVYNVGIGVGKLLNFLVQKGAKVGKIHIIGHSLGAHIAGVAGKKVPNLKRITGLDPACPMFETNLIYRLNDRDAKFVDVIHCSNGLTVQGYGLLFPVGDINFYPNGGDKQPACKIGRHFFDTDSDVMEIKSEMDAAICRHTICPLYFLYSIEECEYASRECETYSKHKNGNCSTKAHSKNSMGEDAKKISGVAANSKFYLKTTEYPPFCSCDEN